MGRLPGINLTLQYQIPKPPFHRLEKQQGSLEAGESDEGDGTTAAGTTGGVEMEL